MLTTNFTKVMTLLWAAVSLMVLFTMPFSWGLTNEQDVNAINNLYVSLGSPPIPGWVANGGDPCMEKWQGVQCLDSNISSIILNGANLGGQLGDKLANFTAIMTIDLSNNNIGGSIPENLPLTMKNFFLSANQFTGSIPSSLSELTLLSDMSLNENFLTGELPDAFQSLTGLINLDLSSNNLSGRLPPSMASLSSLTTLHVQNNQLSGTLNVLQDLPLKDLNIENNIFSGPIPEKLLNIPNFKKDGNPFNTTSALSPSPSPPPSPPPLPPTQAPPHITMPANSSNRPPIQHSGPPGNKKKISVIRVFGLVVAGLCVIIIAVLSLIYLISKWQERKQRHEELAERKEVRAHRRPSEPQISTDLIKPNNEMNKALERQEVRADGRPRDPQIKTDLDKPNNNVEKVPREAAETQEHKIDISGTRVLVMQPLKEKDTSNPSVSTEKPKPSTEIINPPTSVVSFSVASLQQYTNSFSEDNLIKDGRLGQEYLAELPEGKLLVVLKLDSVNAKISVDDFFELVLSISELRHPNILELVGYCAEFEQRLLVYKYFSKRTLYDALHCEDEFKKKLSWNARIHIALGAAKALEYLHEICQPPIVHQNFEPRNVLLNDDLAVCISECGLASLVSSNSVAQLSGRIRALFSYEAPEVIESGSCSEQSDVYSFGVVMLELLTGREPYDNSRPRAEQHLVRWANSQLHDIDALSRMVDPSLDGKYPVKSLSRFADIISRCIQGGPEFRPAMSEVVQDLRRVLKDASRGGGGDPQPS